LGTTGTRQNKIKSHGVANRLTEILASAAAVVVVVVAVVAVVALVALVVVVVVVVVANASVALRFVSSAESQTGS
jgi:hypothetical protein